MTTLGYLVIGALIWGVLHLLDERINLRAQVEDEMRRAERERSKRGCPVLGRAGREASGDSRQGLPWGKRSRSPSKQGWTVVIKVV